MLRRAVTVTLPCILASLLAFACGGDPSPEQVATSSDPVERGQRIYIERCATCHGPTGEGQPNWQATNPDGTLPAPPLDGSAHSWHHGDGTLYKQVSLGGAYLEQQGLAGFKSGMPAFGELLTHAEILDVLAYVKSLWGDQAIHGTTKREAQAMVSENDPFPPSP